MPEHIWCKLRWQHSHLKKALLPKIFCWLFLQQMPKVYYFSWGLVGGKVVLFSVFLSSLFYFFPSITVLYYFGARWRENILKSRRNHCKTTEIRLVIVAETTLICSLCIVRFKMLLLLSLLHCCNITVEYNNTMFLFGGIKMNDRRIFGFYDYAYISK